MRVICFAVLFVFAQIQKQVAEQNSINNKIERVKNFSNLYTKELMLRKKSQELIKRA